MQPPQSLGALPVARAIGDKLLLPLADDEAFWIGVSSEDDSPFTILVRAFAPSGGEYKLGHGGRAVPPFFRIDGTANGDTMTALCRTDAEGQAVIEKLLIAGCSAGQAARVRTATILLVDYATFSAASSREAPESIDPDAGYDGQLLP